jgi:aryl-alcohol dehydrogenase-like predicted oxidoreductase|tara:strand:+ start:1292 stop:2053 length:762 start_codon:yes stop_codon:yes gene_type:complete
MDLSDFAYGTASVGSKIGFSKFVKLANIARSNGLRRFDSAPQYGRGLSQVFLSRYLSNLNDNSLKISSKVGRLPALDLKTSLILLKHREFKHLLRLNMLGNVQPEDFSVEGITKSHDFALRSIDRSLIDTLFLHSSLNSILGSDAGATFFKICSAGFKLGISDPTTEDFDYIMGHHPESWCIQVSAEQLLRDENLQLFPGQIWINSIIRYSRYKRIELKETLERIERIRNYNRILVIGFNNEEIFDQLSKISI